MFRIFDIFLKEIGSKQRPPVFSGLRMRDSQQRRENKFWHHEVSGWSITTKAHNAQRIASSTRIGTAQQLTEPPALILALSL